MNTIDIVAHGVLVIAGVLSCGLVASGFNQRHSYPWAWTGDAVFRLLLGVFFLALILGTLIAWQL